MALIVAIKICEDVLTKTVALSRANLISTHGHRTKIRINLCVNALSRANLISTLPLLRASVYAGFRPCFCRYLSEYSEKYIKQGVKVGKGWIVFIRVQSVEAFYTYDYT